MRKTALETMRERREFLRGKVFFSDRRQREAQREEDRLGRQIAEAEAQEIRDADAEEQRQAERRDCAQWETQKPQRDQRKEIRAQVKSYLLSIPEICAVKFSIQDLVRAEDQYGGEYWYHSDLDLLNLAETLEAHKPKSAREIPALYRGDWS